MKHIKKQDLPTKVCPICQRPFAWRKKWKDNWEQVLYCSKSAVQQNQIFKLMKTGYQHLKSATILALTIFALNGCSSNKSPAEEPETPSPGTSTSPVETLAPNSSYKPAFAGQTRVSGLKTTTAYRFEVLTSSLRAHGE
jgi:hypothetical protein